MKRLSTLMTSRPVKAVLIDCSGTLHIQDEPTPNAAEALNRLRQQPDLALKFVTNTTKESISCLLKRLRHIGFQVEEQEVFSTLTATRKLIESQALRPFFMIDPKAMEDFQGIDQQDPNAVVIGLAPAQLNYENMNTAMRTSSKNPLQNGFSLIAMNKSRYYKRSDGLALGTGPFVAALEYATGVQSTVVGKPSKQFFLSSISDFHCDPSQCVMVGDDVQDDIRGSQDIGMKGILVRTGKYQDGDEQTIHPPPFRTVADFSEAVDVIINLI